MLTILSSRCFLVKNGDGGGGGVVVAVITGRKKPDTPKGDAVHVHGMWYQPSPMPQVMSRDLHSREKLINAYMGMADGAAGLPRNADAHLWTDRKNLHALYMPIAKSNGAEIELPHSMLAKAPLTVHLDGEIEAVIAAFKVAEKTHRVLETGKYTFERGIDPEVVDVYRGDG